MQLIKQGWRNLAADADKGDLVIRCSKYRQGQRSLVADADKGGLVSRCS